MQPSVEEYKRRHIENIEKLVQNQSKLVTFSATLECNNTENKIHENESNNANKNEIEVENNTKNIANYIKDMKEIFSFPFVFSNGKIKFDSQLAKKLPSDSNLRILRNLWSGEKKII